MYAIIYLVSKTISDNFFVIIYVKTVKYYECNLVLFVFVMKFHLCLVVI